jgi:hypothetical protein
MVKRVQPWQWASRPEKSADGNPEDHPMGMKKAVFKEIHRMESTEEAGQSTTDNGSRVSF